MNIPDFALPVLTGLRPTFSTPTYNRFLVLLLGALLTTGRRTITNVLRAVRHQAPGHASSYHRVFSQRHWSPWSLARGLMTFLLAHVVPTGPVFLAGDDTVAERPGPKVFGKGRHRDGVRPTHSYTDYRWGHKWVVVLVLVKLPFATRPWAFPALVALYRAPRRGIRPTGCATRRLRISRGSCSPASSAGSQSASSTLWATPAMAPARRHGFAVNIAAI